VLLVVAPPALGSFTTARQAGPPAALVEAAGEDAPLGQWSRGFTFGHRWLRNAWQDRVPDDLEAEYGAAVLAMGFFSSRDVAQACRQQAEAMESVDEMAGHMLKMLPQAHEMYFNLGQAIRQALDELGPGRQPSNGGSGQRH